MDRRGDSFDEFVAANADGLMRTAFLIVWDEKEAEDLVQESFLRVARHWRRVATMEQPLAYTRRVLVNLAVGERQKRWRRRAELAWPAPDLGVDLSTLETYAEREELLAALRQLPARQRAVLVLRYLHDFSEVQIAQALGCGTGTVKSTAARGLIHLRELLEQNSADLTGEIS